MFGEGYCSAYTYENDGLRIYVPAAS